MHNADTSPTSLRRPSSTKTLVARLTTNLYAAGGVPLVAQRLLDAPMGLMPMTSNAIAIVFAVNWPPQAPAPGPEGLDGEHEARVRAPAARVAVLGDGTHSVPNRHHRACS